MNVQEMKVAYQAAQCALQQVSVDAGEKAKAMLAAQNAQFAMACLAQMNKGNGRCEGCGQ